METMVEKMIADYEINIMGRTMEIRNIWSDKIYYLFKSGSGYTFSDGYEGTETGELYQSNGKHLILVGECRSYIGKEDSSIIQLKGVEFKVPCSADNLFTKIFKKQ